VFVEPTAGYRAAAAAAKGIGPVCPDLRSNGILMCFDEVICGWGQNGGHLRAQAFGVTGRDEMAKALPTAPRPMGRGRGARQTI